MLALQGQRNKTLCTTLFFCQVLSQYILQYIRIYLNIKSPVTRIKYLHIKFCTGYAIFHTNTANDIYLKVLKVPILFNVYI